MKTNLHSTKVKERMTTEKKNLFELATLILIQDKVREATEVWNKDWNKSKITSKSKKLTHLAQAQDQAQ